MDLKVITGPMFSGKTTELLRMLKNYEIARKKVLLLKPEIDIRYQNVSTHDGISRNCTKVSDITKLDEQVILSYDVVGIDEGQFIEGLYNFIKKFLDKKIIFIIAGLVETFNSCILFEDMSKLFSISNDSRKLNSICNECGSDKGCYSYNVALGKSESEKIVLGGLNEYLSLCRSCYFSK